MRPCFQLTSAVPVQAYRDPFLLVFFALPFDAGDAVTYQDCLGALVTLDEMVDVASRTLLCLVWQ